MKLGIAIVAWRRAKYLKQLIESLEKNNLEDVDFHLFVDGHLCRFSQRKVCEITDVEKTIEVFEKSNLPNKNVHRQEYNVGPAINQYETMELMSKNYERFLFLENDIVVSKNFVAMMKKALEEFKDNEQIACISPGFRLKCYPEEIDMYKDKLMFSDGHFWAEAFWSKKWELIKIEYMPYYEYVRNVPYMQRDMNAIDRLFRSTGIPRYATSQDNGKDWAILRAGLRRARFVVNRATGIGDYGIHSTPKKLQQTGDGHQEIFDFDDELGFELGLTSLKLKSQLKPKIGGQK